MVAGFGIAGVSNFGLRRLDISDWLTSDGKEVLGTDRVLNIHAGDQIWSRNNPEHSIVMNGDVYMFENGQFCVFSRHFPNLNIFWLYHNPDDKVFSFAQQDIKTDALRLGDLTVYPIGNGKDWYDERRNTGDALITVNNLLGLYGAEKIDPDLLSEQFVVKKRRTYYGFEF